MKKKATPKRKGRAVWISRDKGYGMVDFNNSQPKLGEDCFYGGDTFYDCCMKDFTRITGYRLKPGECRQVRITVEDVPAKRKAVRK